MTDSDRGFEPVLGERQVVIDDETSEGTRDPSHASIRELLAEYLEGTLAAPRQDIVRQHVDRCPSCRAFLRTLESTVELVGQLPSHELPDRVRRRILDRLATTADRSVGGE